MRHQRPHEKKRNGKYPEADRVPPDTEPKIPRTPAVPSGLKPAGPPSLPPSMQTTGTDSSIEVLSNPSESVVTIRSAPTTPKSNRRAEPDKWESADGETDNEADPDPVVAERDFRQPSASAVAVNAGDAQAAGASQQPAPPALAPPTPSLQVTGTSPSAARQTARNGTQTLGLSRIPANDQLVRQQIQAARDDGLRAVKKCDEAWKLVAGRERQRAASDLAVANSERDKLLSMIADFQKKEADAKDRADQNEEFMAELMLDAGWTQGSDGTWHRPSSRPPRPPASAGSQDSRNAAESATEATAGLPTAKQRAGLTPYEPGPNVVALPPPAASAQQSTVPVTPAQLPTSNSLQSNHQRPNRRGLGPMIRAMCGGAMIETSAKTSNSIHKRASMDQRSFAASRLLHQPDPQPNPQRNQGQTSCETRGSGQRGSE